MRKLISLFIAVVFAGGIATGQDSEKKLSYYLIGNSLTWDTVPPKLDGDTQWHVDCGKSLPFIYKNPEKPCVKTSTLWPTALKEKQYDFIALQSHYGSTLVEDAMVISELMKLQKKAVIIIHTGWARSAERANEWAIAEANPSSEMKHNVAYIEALVELVRKTNPGRDVRRTRAMDMLQQVSDDIKAGKAPVKEVADLYRDKIHMNIATGRYLMHNAMRHALGQPRFEGNWSNELTPEMKTYLDSVLNRVLEDQKSGSE